MGISHAFRGACARDLFPGTQDPSKRFPCTQPSARCGATEIAPSSLVDARLTDLSAPLGTTGSLRATEARIQTVHGRASPLAVAVPPLLTASAESLSSRHPRRAWRNHSTSGSCSTHRSVAPARRCRLTCARCFHGLSALHTPSTRTCTSEEVCSEEQRGRPAAAVLLRHQRREAEPPGADVMPDTERRAPSRGAEADPMGREARPGDLPKKGSELTTTPAKIRCGRPGVQSEPRSETPPPGAPPARARTHRARGVNRRRRAIAG